MSSERPQLEYRELEQAIRNMPMTWCPAVLMEAVKRCVRLGVFKKESSNLSMVSPLQYFVGTWEQQERKAMEDGPTKKT